MLKKSNKIMVAVSTNDKARMDMIAKIAVELKFAVNMTDAKKIIRGSPFDYDLSTAFFILAHTYNLRDSPSTTHRLYELAARGIAVVIGVKKLPPEFEFITEAFFPEDLVRR